MAVLLSYDERKQQGICTYPGCPSAASDESCECEPHRRKRQKRVAKSLKKRRAKWKAEGRCVECGRVRRKGSNWGCQVCDPAPENNTVHKKRERIAARLIPWENSPKNEGRLRLRGGRSGPQSKRQLDEQDLTDATTLLQRSKDELAYAASPEVAELPRIQRLDATRAALNTVYRAARFALSVLARHGEDVTELVMGVAKTET